MSGTLAVFTPQLGTVSETFIRRHIEDLLPGRTVIVAWHSSHHMDGHWVAPVPTLFLDRRAASIPFRLARRVRVPERRLLDRAVGRFLRRHKVDLVLGEYLHLFVDFVPLLDHMGMPYVVQGHGIDLSAALRDPHKAEQYFAYKSARAVLTRSELHRRRLVELGLPAANLHVNPGGVDLPAAIPRRGVEAGKRLLAIGRMTAKKGPLHLLEAFRLAASQDGALRLDYVGAGELFPAARQFVDAHGLRGRVTLHGVAADEVKQHLLAECGVFVQHSLTDPASGDEEGLPASIQEAMAHGLAVISTRHSGIADAVDEGSTGLLVAEGDTQGMAAAMLELSAECGLTTRMGHAGHAKAERLYTWTAERSRLLHHLGLAGAE
jgi:glycosyltransferase involved in cell wall biosynthesis